MYKHMEPAKLELIRKQLISKGYPSYWPELSDLVREEYDFTCAICGRRSTDCVTDHINGKPWDVRWENLRCVCKGYNTSNGKCAPNKPFNCEGCGRPIRHRGYCLACNMERREG
jgi:hypothetical protein